MAKKKDPHFLFLNNPDAAFSITNQLGEVLDKPCKVWLHLAKSPEFRTSYYNSLIDYIRLCVDKRKVPGVSIEHSLSTLYFLSFIPYILPLQDKPLPRDCQGIARASLILETDLNQIMSFGLKTVEALVPELLQAVVTLPQLAYTHRDIKYTSYLTGQEVVVSNLSDLTPVAGPYSYFFTLNPLFAEFDYGKSTFVYLYLHTLLDQYPQLQDLVCSLLVKMMQQLPVDDPGFEQKLLPILFIMGTTVLRYTSRPQGLLQLSSEVEGFRHWPLPYSSAANLLYTLLSSERQNPGLALMQKLRTDWKPMTVLKISEKEATEFILAQTCSAQARLFVALTRREYDGFMAVPKVEGISRASVIAHCMRIKWVSMQLDGKMSRETVAKVAELGLEEGFQVYERVYGLLTDERRDRRSGFEEISRLILQAKPATEFALPNAYANSSFPSSYNLPYPPILISQLDPDICPVSSTAVLSDSFRVNGSDIRVSHIYNYLQVLLRPSPHPVKLALSGSDELIHAFLLAYYKLISADNDLYETVSLQLYLIPELGKTDSLSQYLSSVDPWYQRHVYVPLKRMPWAPVLTQEELNEVRGLVNPGRDPANPPELQLPPVRMVGHLIKDFLQEADTRLHVFLYEVECTSLKTSCVFPFCMYVEIGITAAAKREQRNNPDSSIEAILESKTFKYEPVPIHLKVTPVDLFGVESAIEEIPNKLIHRLAVSNIPRVGDRTAPASPLNEWLELSFIDKDNAVEEAVFLKRAKSGRQIPHELNNILSSLYSGLHVKEVEISSAIPFEGFDLLVDGEVYGPFTVIRITPMRPLASDDAPSLRVMTFIESEKL